MSFEMRLTEVARASVLARLLFYVVGTVAFAIIGVAFVTAWNSQPQSGLDPSQPMLQLSAAEFSKLQPQRRAAQSASGWYEILQIGKLHDRDVDFTLAVEMPKETDRILQRDFRREMGDLSEISAAIFAFPASYYDLETRFGPVRAANFQIKTDGRIKLCMGYVSRFETGALNIKGWYCEANGSKPIPYALACMLDEMTSTGPLPSKAAQAFLTQRLVSGPRCAADPVTQTADTGPRRPLKRLID